MGDAQVSDKNTIVIQCPSCKGAGLYQGMAERNGAAVVCHSCKGTGQTTYTYEDFTGRKVKEGVERVFAGSFGYVHTAENFQSADAGLIRFEEGGCTYQEWLNGAEPKPVKDLYCPYIWNNTGSGNEPCSRCKDGNKLGRRISTCTLFNDKAKCWEEYESK